MIALLLIMALFQSAQDLYTAANADFDAGRWPDAAAKYEQVLKEDPTHIPSQFNLAVCFTKIGNTSGAIAAYRTLLERDANIYEARTNLAILLDQTGALPEAEQEYQKALALRPDDAQAHFNLGMFFMRSHESTKAYPHLKTAAEK